MRAAQEEVMRQGCGTPSGGSPENRPERDFEWESGEAKGLPIVAPRRCHGTTRWYAWGRHRPVTGEKAHICGAFGSALGRTRTCDLLIRRGTFNLTIDPVTARTRPFYGLPHRGPISLNPPWPVRIPSRGWYRRWYGNLSPRDVYGIVGRVEPVPVCGECPPFGPLC
jgi:hypothetical protein